MSAESRQKWSLEKTISHVAILLADALLYINKEGRSEKMIESLKRALQFFKENRLGDVLPEMASKKERPAPNASVLERRREFKKHLKQFGLTVVTGEFYAKLSGRARNCLDGSSQYPYQVSDRPSVLEVVLNDRHLFGINLRNRRGLGKGTMAEIEKALDDWGLGTDMTAEEVVDVFGEFPKPQEAAGFDESGLQREFKELIKSVANLSPEEKYCLARSYDDKLGQSYENLISHVPKWERGVFYRSALWKLAGKSMPEH